MKPKFTQLEELDKEMEELKKVEPEQVDEEYRKKPQRSKIEKEKPVLMEIVRKSILPQKPKIHEIPQDVVNFAEIKLRKPSKIEKKPTEEMKLPKFLLKSRINYIDFPPLSEIEQKPIITILEPVVKDNGVISRNAKEAEKILKTKRKN